MTAMMTKARHPVPQSRFRRSRGWAVASALGFLGIAPVTVAQTPPTNLRALGTGLPSLGAKIAPANVPADHRHPSNPNAVLLDCS